MTLSDATATPAPEQGRTETMVVADRIVKSFGSHVVLKDISLTVNRGEVVCVIGPSGSGKSTFLRCINHLEKIDGEPSTVDGDLIGYRQHGPANTDLARSTTFEHHRVQRGQLRQ